MTFHVVGQSKKRLIMTTGHWHEGDKTKIHREIEIERKKIKEYFKGNLKRETKFIFLAT